MITDKQFIDSFTAAGGWFLLKNFEEIYNWKGTKADLIERLYKEGFDGERSGTATRVSSVLRIIDNQRGEDALLKIRDSKRINQLHPGASVQATALLKKYYNN